MDKVDTSKDGVYIVKGGELKKLSDPSSGYGSQTINWQQGKITHCEVSYTEK
jgi:Protein of unknown function (DUF3954)